MVKVSDWLVNFLIQKGIKDLFYLPGGGISHLTDSLIGKDINGVVMRHEQAVTFACEGYSRIKGMSACFVTSGVGAVNALQGVASAYSDNIPMIVVSGDMPHIDIVAMYEPVTCYAVDVLRPADIKHKLRMAYERALSYKRPVLVNIPWAVQAGDINDTKLYCRQIPPRAPYTKLDLSNMVFDESKYRSPYKFFYDLKNRLTDNDIVVTGNGLDAYIALKVLDNPITNLGYGAMGFDLPAAIGVAIASKKHVILVTGDGSIVLNIQELETIKRLKLNIDVYIFMNEGYGTIRRSEMRDFKRLSPDKFEFMFDSPIFHYINIDPDCPRL